MCPRFVYLTLYDINTPSLRVIAHAPMCCVLTRVTLAALLLNSLHTIHVVTSVMHTHKYRHLYWVPKSLAKIYKMRMDGSSPPELFWSAEHPTAEEKVIGIAINYEENHYDFIYWGTQTTDRTGALWRRGLTGLQTARTIKVLNQKPLHVATFKYNVYYHYQSRIFGDLINSFSTILESNNLVLSRASRRNIQDFTDFVIVHHSLQPGEPWSCDLWSSPL